MKPKFQQLGITEELAGEAPADYSGTDFHPLNRKTRQAIRARGTQGATIEEVAKVLEKTAASIRTRFNELRSLGYIRPTEAERNGTVYVCTEKELP